MKQTLLRAAGLWRVHHYLAGIRSPAILGSKLFRRRSRPAQTGELGLGQAPQPGSNGEAGFKFIANPSVRITDENQYRETLDRFGAERHVGILRPYCGRAYHVALDRS